jgi:hypothetical protein
MPFHYPKAVRPTSQDEEGSLAGGRHFRRIYVGFALLAHELHHPPYVGSTAPRPVQSAQCYSIVITRLSCLVPVAENPFRHDEANRICVSLIKIPDYFYVREQSRNPAHPLRREWDKRTPISRFRPSRDVSDTNRMFRSISPQQEIENFRIDPKMKKKTRPSYRALASAVWSEVRRGRVATDGFVGRRTSRVQPLTAWLFGVAYRQFCPSPKTSQVNGQSPISPSLGVTHLAIPFDY